MLVASGGVIGSLVRYLLNEIIGDVRAGVLTANLLGVAIAGFALVYSQKVEKKSLQLFLLPGFCGGLTTFSSVMLYAHQFGAFYLFDTLVFSLLVVFITIPVARRILHR